MKKKTTTTKQYLALSIDPASIDSEKKQFKVVVATETPVFRRANYLNGWSEDYNEILVCNKDNMRTQRMDNGVCPLLDNHDQFTGVTKQYGSLIAYEVSDGEVRATIQFSVDPAHDGIWKNIEAGIIRGISARYIPWVYERKVYADGKVSDYRATDWEITEVSLAPVPADYNSMVRSQDQQQPQGEKFEVIINNFQNTKTRSNMEGQNPTTGEGQQPNTPNSETRSQQSATPTPGQPVNVEQVRAQAAAEERTRISNIRSAVRTAGLEDAVAEELIASDISIDAARAQIFEKMAARQQSQNPAPRTQGANVAVIGTDEADQIRSAMQDAILHRVEPGSIKLNEKSSDFRGMKLIDMARYMLQENGENPFKYSQREQVQRAIATTDFPDLLTSTVGRQLRRFFEAVNSNWQQLGQRTTVSDFRAKTGVQVDGSTTFEKIAEGGEYKSSKILQNSKATIGVETYGRLIKIGRQAIINDDLDVFSRIPKMFAQGAANLQAKMFWDMVTGNVKTPDGKDLFHADHKNLAAAGGAIDETALNAGIVAMMLQQSPAKEELGLTPKYLIVPVELETTAKKLIASVTATKTGDVNPFNNRFEIISEVRLSRNSSKAWYMAADPATVEGLMYAYLDGEEGLYTESRTNFEDDSVETKARMEFGVAAWEYRGWYKNPGA